jgi:hypothetical protein
MKKLAITLAATALLSGLLLMLTSGPAAAADKSTADREPGQRTKVTTPSGITVEILRVAPTDADVAWQANLPLPAGLVTVFEEDFDSLPFVGEIPTGWHTYDEDGDSYTWELNDVTSYEGNNCVASPTASSPGSDNWIVTPLIEVPDGGGQLQFYARHVTSGQAFEVWQSGYGNSPFFFTSLGDLVAEDTTRTSGWELYSYTIEDVIFNDAYVAIRHVSNDGFGMLVDAVTLPNAGAEFVGFEGPHEFPPAGWSQIVETGLGTVGWYLSDGSDTHPTGVTPHSGTHMAEFDSWNAIGPGESTRLRTPILDFGGYDNLYRLSFWMYHDDDLPGNDDNLKVEISDGGDWITLETLNRYSPTPHWEEHTYSLRYFAGDPSVQISFLAESWLGNGIYIDDVKITREAGEALCYMVGESGIFMDILDVFSIPTGYYTYFDPEYHCGSPYPFSMTSVYLTLGDPGDCVWPVNLDVVIRKPNDYFDPCAEPGTELARYSLVADEANFKYPEFGYLNIPEPLCITTPVFIGIEYRSGDMETTPSLYFSNDYSPPLCNYWLWDMVNFHEWNDIWAGTLGAPMFTVIGTEKSAECQFEVFYYEEGITPVPHPDSNVAWHQIWSEEDFGSSWHQDKIVGDTAGLLEGTDKIYLSLLPERTTTKQVQILDIVHVFELEDVTSSDTVYLYYQGPGNGDPYYNYPSLCVDCFWSVDWPYEHHGRLLNLTYITDNGNGVLDGGDVVTLSDQAGDFISGSVLDVYTGVFAIEVTPEYLCGDADGNELVNISDAVYLIAYIFGGGPAPYPLLAGDADCNGFVNISDAVYLIAYIFGGGPAPCASCP